MQAEPETPMPEFSAAERVRITLIADSFGRLIGRPLVGVPCDEIQALWDAPLAIVAHGTEPDPIFFFGNRLALELFEMRFEDFTRLPSRLSAEPLLREERARLLDRVSKDGFIQDYAGVRVSSTGQKFRIEHAIVWNLIDSEGIVRGQAAAFDRWTRLQTPPDLAIDQPCIINNHDD